jgi:hypothetical protein
VPAQNLKNLEKSVGASHGQTYGKLQTKCVRKLAGSHAPRISNSDNIWSQTGTANIAKGAAVAAMRMAAMIRNQWTGKVARRALMVETLC